jgi:hypothetical protein
MCISTGGPLRPARRNGANGWTIHARAVPSGFRLFGNNPLMWPQLERGSEQNSQDTAFWELWRITTDKSASVRQCSGTFGSPNLDAPRPK